MLKPGRIVIYFTTFLVTCHSKFVNNECHSQKLEGCFCGKIFYYDRTHFTVNCTNLGFNNVTMLQDLPEETETLIFSGNNISTLPWNIFGVFNKLKMLKIIDMSNNQIRIIKGKTYHHVPNVEVLILNHNNLAISDKSDVSNHHPRIFSNFVNLQELHLTNAFADYTDADLADNLHEIFFKSNLALLRKLHLEQNEIKNFKDPNLFCDLHNLTQLYLGNNYLTGIDFNLNCLKLQFLDLEQNRITVLRKGDLDSLDLLVSSARSEPLTIDLRGNPLKCEIATELYNWLLSTNVTIRLKERLQCVSTKFGITYNVNLRDLFETKQTKLSNSIVVLLTVLVIVLVLLLSAFAYMYRCKIMSRMDAIMEIVSGKVQYTTIESQVL